MHVDHTPPYYIPSRTSRHLIEQRKVHPSAQPGDTALFSIAAFLRKDRRLRLTKLASKAPKARWPLREDISLTPKHLHDCAMISLSSEGADMNIFARNDFFPSPKLFAMFAASAGFDFFEVLCSSTYEATGSFRGLCSSSTLLLQCNPSAGKRASGSPLATPSSHPPIVAAS